MLCSPANTSISAAINIERREREFLTPHEIDRLIDAAKKQGRHGPRDAG